jgi:hypothetical protein
MVSIATPYYYFAFFIVLPTAVKEAKWYLIGKTEKNEECLLLVETSTVSKKKRKS